MENKNFKYLEVFNRKTKEVVERINVSSQSERSIEKIERGIRINMNVVEFTTRIIDSKTELPRP